MSRPYLLLSCLLCLLSLAGATARATDPDVLLDSQPTELLTRTNQANYGKFDGHGKLTFQEIKLTSLDPPWLSTLVYFPRGSQPSNSGGFRLQHNLGNINVFLAAEIRRPRTVRTFVEEHLVEFLINNLGDDLTTIIDQHLVDGGEAVQGYGGTRLSAAVRTERTARLQRYVLPGDPTMVGERWRVEVNVIIRGGAVQHWLVRGGLSPLRVESFVCELKEPDGTFHTLLLTH